MARRGVPEGVKSLPLHVGRQGPREASTSHASRVPMSSAGTPPRRSKTSRCLCQHQLQRHTAFWRSEHCSTAMTFDIVAAFLIGKDRGAQTGEYVYMRAPPEWKPIYDEWVRELPPAQRMWSGWTETCAADVQQARSTETSLGKSSAACTCA